MSSLYSETFPFIKFCISSALADLFGLSTTNALGTSPDRGSGTPTTAASATAGWVLKIASNSAGGT